MLAKSVALRCPERNAGPNANHVPAAIIKSSGKMLHAMKDRTVILDAIPALSHCFRDRSDECCATDLGSGASPVWRLSFCRYAMMSRRAEVSSTRTGILVPARSLPGSVNHEIVCGPSDAGTTERWRVVVFGSRAGLAAEDAAEHGAALVRIEAMTRGAPLAEELLAMNRVRFRGGRETGKVFGVVWIRRAEERVGQRDRPDIARFRIARQRRVDEENDGHIDLLMRVEPLLLEAEALDLVEIDAGRLGRHHERRMPDDRLIGEVLGREEHELLLAEMNPDLALGRLEAPRQIARDVAVEAHRNHPLRYGCPVGIRPLRRAAESGCSAEQPIQRRRICDETDHHADKDDARHDDLQVSASLGIHRLSFVAQPFVLAHFFMVSPCSCIIGPISPCCMAPTLAMDTVTSTLPAFSKVRLRGKVCPSFNGCLSPTTMMCMLPGLKATFPPGGTSTARISRMRDTPFSSLTL